MDEQLKSNLTSSKHWIRLLFMILFALALQVVSIVMTALVVVQFLFALVTGSDNLQLRKFGDSLSIFIFDTLQFLIYNSEEKPFPFADWPESRVKTGDAPAAEVEVITAPVAKPKKAPVKRKPATKPEPDSDPEADTDEYGEAGLNTRNDTE